MTQRRDHRLLTALIVNPAWSHAGFLGNPELAEFLVPHNCALNGKVVEPLDAGGDLIDNPCKMARDIEAGWLPSNHHQGWSPHSRSPS